MTNLSRALPSIAPTSRIAAYLFLLASASATAATKTWDGGAATANWSDAANWNSNGTPTSSNAILLDNSAVNPLPQLSAQSGATCGTLTIDGAANATFLNYGGSTPLVTNLYGASVNAANTGPLLNITANAPASLTANKVNFHLRTGNGGQCANLDKTARPTVAMPAPLPETAASRAAVWPTLASFSCVAAAG